LADAIEDCVKSKHDAIDAMIDVIVIWFEEMEKQIGLDQVTKLFPAYLETTSRIAILQDAIVESRGNRVAGREGVYDTIETDDYDNLLRLFNSMKTSLGRVQAMVTVQAKKERRDFWLLVITTATSVILVGFEIYKLLAAYLSQGGAANTH
jgi:hypothetical protein